MLEPRRRLEPAGGMKLVLCSFGRSESKRTWADTGALVLEDQLNEVMLALREHAKSERRKLAEQNEWHRRREEEQRRVQERQRRRELEERQARELLDECPLGLELVTSERILSICIAWARARAERMDPLAAE